MQTSLMLFLYPLGKTSKLKKNTFLRGHWPFGGVLWGVKTYLGNARLKTFFQFGCLSFSTVIEIDEDGAFSNQNSDLWFKNLNINVLINVFWCLLEYHST